MKVIYITVLLSLVLICCETEKINECQSNEEQEVLTEQETTPVQENVLPGGFQQIPTDSETALNAFEFLKSQLAISHPQISCESIKSAAIQLVAGMKIILVCNYKTGDQGTSKHTLYTLIYIDIKSNKSIIELNINYGE